MLPRPAARWKPQLAGARVPAPPGGCCAPGTRRRGASPLPLAVAVTALPYLARALQRLTQVLIGLAALASVVGGSGLPLNVAGSLAIGWAAASAVRLLFGSPLGLPSADDVRLLLLEVGIAADNVRPLARQVWGVAKYRVARQRGRPASVPAGDRGRVRRHVLRPGGRDRRRLRHPCPASYLPPVWGWLTLVWLRGREYP